MLKKIKAKLHGNAGESIAETLIATLIAALALVMLAGAVASAARIITDSRKAIEKYPAEAEIVREGWRNAVADKLAPPTPAP